MEEKQAWIGYCKTEDNADITQSQACDSKNRRMKKVNSWFTDSRALLAEYCIVGIPHNAAIYSFLTLIFTIS